MTTSSKSSEFLRTPRGNQTTKDLYSRFDQGFVIGPFELDDQVTPRDGSCEADGVHRRFSTRVREAKSVEPRDGITQAQG